MKVIKGIFRLVFKLFMWGFVLSLITTAVFKFVPVPLTVMMVNKWIYSDSGQKYHFYKEWVPLEEISPDLISAVVAAEDQKFPEHNGFDWEALEDAYQKNKTGKKIRGGSTISQQTAKNVFLWPGRNYLRKGLEAYFTFLIEFIWGKERIMEVYLNVIELGPGIYGAEAAAQEFYNKPAAKLNRYECAMMATCLPNPVKYSLARPGNYMLQRQKWILRNMQNLGKIEL